MIRAQKRWTSIWKKAQAVCFDVDSTVCQEEGIDMLAKYCGVEKEVKAWTSRAMDGNVKFEDALAARLDIIKPKESDIMNCLKKFPPQLSPGIDKLIQNLHQRQIDTFLVSGGFRLMIQPIATQLNVKQVYANTIYFDKNGLYSGFDKFELTSRDGGKSKALEKIKAEFGYETMVMVGDGVTDMQAKPPADLVIGYGGIVEREIVREQADIFIRDFHELL